MSDTAIDPPSDGHRQPTRRNWYTSALLVTFTVLVAVACIVILSCTLTQTRVSTLVIDGVGISIPKLDYVGRRWVALRQDHVRLEKLERESSDLARTAAETELTVKDKKDDLEQLLAAFYHRIADSEPKFAAIIHQKSHTDQYGRIQGARAELIKQHPELDPVIDEIESAYKRHRIADSENDSAQMSLKVVQQQIAIVAKRNSEAMRSNFDLIKSDLDKDAKARIENAFYELNINNYDCGLNEYDGECGYVGGYVTRSFYRLLTLRSDLLTLLLVILMGVLGSALQMTHAYFMKNQVQSVGGYFQRLSVGAVTALVIFIVAKAGVPMIADPARLGGDAPINPYFVSFLAIASGLLSENAIANIQAQGARLFGAGSGEPDRWARHDLTPDLQEQGLSLKDLASYLGKNEEVVGPMLRGTEKMDAAQQKILALYLRRDPRELFTDIPPPPPKGDIPPSPPGETK